MFNVINDKNWFRYYDLKYDLKVCRLHNTNRGT